MINLSYRFDQNSSSLELDGMPDVSNGDSENTIGILSSWSLKIIGSPTLEGEKDHLENLMQVILQYSRSYISGIRKTFISKKIMKDILSILDIKVLDQREKKIIQNSYLSYPDYNDPDFVYDISRKAEFFHCKNLLNLMELENKCSSRNFEFKKPHMTLEISNIEAL